jgi:hypothetical protein
VIAGWSRPFCALNDASCAGVIVLPSVLTAMLPGASSLTAKISTETIASVITMLSSRRAMIFAMRHGPLSMRAMGEMRNDLSHLGERSQR